MPTGRTIRSTEGSRSSIWASSNASCRWEPACAIAQAKEHDDRLRPDIDKEIGFTVPLWLTRQTPLKS
jgi:hypothetical protein